MEQNLGVKVVYRNNQMEAVYEKEYTLRDYCDMLREDLLRLITDVEDLAYRANDGKCKEEWSDSTWEIFGKIKHKILDKAGDIGRLPQNLCEKEAIDNAAEEQKEMSLSAFVANVFKRV